MLIYKTIWTWYFTSSCVCV